MFFGMNSTLNYIELFLWIYKRNEYNKNYTYIRLHQNIKHVYIFILKLPSFFLRWYSFFTTQVKFISAKRNTLRIYIVLCFI